MVDTKAGCMRFGCWVIAEVVVRSSWKRAHKDLDFRDEIRAPRKKHQGTKMSRKTQVSSFHVKVLAKAVDLYQF